jgi:hypothetical protein
MAVGRLPETDADLCSQPTISRLENMPRTRRDDLGHLSGIAIFRAAKPAQNAFREHDGR